MALLLNYVKNLTVFQCKVSHNVYAWETHDHSEASIIFLTMFNQQEVVYEVSPTRDKKKILHLYDHMGRIWTEMKK